MNAGRGIKNIIYGLLSQVLTIGISLVVPRLVLVNLGSEVNGLTHSISSFFVYLSLLEAGVGKATNQALYKPLAADDRHAISRIMAATNIYYRKTGVVYAAALIVFAIAYTLLVETTISAWVVFSVVILSGASSVVSYFVQGKYRVLMEAEGRGYVLTNIGSIYSIVVSVCKIALLLLGFGIVEIQGMYFFFSLVQMSVIVLCVRRWYQWLNLKVEPDFEAISQKNYVLLHQITGMIFNNTDVLLLTAFTGLKTVSVYSMYATFYGIIRTVINTFSFSYSYALGQVFHGDKEKFVKLHDVYEVYNMCLTFALMCILQLMILPFMRIYTAGITDINYIDPWIPVLFTTINLLSSGRASSGLVIDFSQHFEQTKGRAILEAMINLIASVIGIQFFGIYGALLGTVAALLYRANDMILYANRLMCRNPWITYKRWMINLAVFLTVSVVGSHLLPEMQSLLQVILWGVILCCTVIPVFLLADSLAEWKTAAYFLKLICSALKKKETLHE